MKRISAGAAPLLLTSFLFGGLTACGGGGGHAGSPPADTLSVSPQPASIPVNGTVTFTATTNGPANELSWVIVGTGDTTVNLGSPISMQGATYTYTAPPAPPIYQAPLTPAGSVALRVSEGATMVQFNIAITAPSIITGFFPPSSNTVVLGQTLGFGAYAVGSTSNAITMQVNGVTGGSTTYGTIAPVNSGIPGEYAYTAPAAMPASGDTVTVTVISQADPTKSSSMAITLTTP